MSLRRRMRDTVDYARALVDVGLAVFERPIIYENPDLDAYGWVDVAPETQQALFNNHVRLDERGFTEVRRGTFARQSTADVIDVLEHYRGRTATFIRWGISLAYVPHDWRYRGRFHRTLKSARPDLFDQDWDGDGIPFIHGVEPFARDLESAWANAEPRATRFWETAATLEGVLSLAEEQIARPPNESGFTIDGLFWPGPRFVRAFTLARMGRLEDAVAALEAWKERRPEEIRNVDEALARVASSTRSG